RRSAPPRKLRESMYDECERGHPWLLGVDDGLVSPALEGFEAQTDWENLESPETYLGSQQAQNFDDEPDALRLNHWTLSGDWTIGRRAAVLNQADGRIAFRIPLPRARGQCRPGPACARGVRTVPRARRRRGSRRRSRARRRRPRPWSGRGAAALSASPRARSDHRPHVRDHLRRPRRRGLGVHVRLEG